MQHALPLALVVVFVVAAISEEVRAMYVLVVLPEDVLCCAIPPVIILSAVS